MNDNSEYPANHCKHNFQPVCVECGTIGGYKAAQRWTQVEEGKEPHGPVWVTDKYGCVQLAYFAHGIRRWYTRDSSDDLIAVVIAWMPIDEPEAFKELANDQM